MTNARLLSKRNIAPVSANVPGSTTAAPLPMTDAVTLRPEEPIGRAIRLLTRSRYSALPVVDVRGALVGLITERDLLIRLSGRKRSWWATLFADNPVLIQEYRKAVGTTVAEVMGPPPQPVPAGASVKSAADSCSNRGSGSCRSWPMGGLSAWLAVRASSPFWSFREHQRGPGPTPSWWPR